RGVGGRERPPLHLVENDLHGDQSDLQQIAVVQHDRHAGRDALVIHVGAVHGADFLEHVIVVAGLDDLGVAAGDRGFVSTEVRSMSGRMPVTGSARPMVVSSPLLKWNAVPDASSMTRCRFAFGCGAIRVASIETWSTSTSRPASFSSSVFASRSR